MKKLPILIIFLFVVAACTANSESTINYSELPESGDVINGESLFTEQACIACHMEGATGAPHLVGLSERAATTVEGQSAREYTFYSIVEPAKHVVEGYGNAMPNRYDESMTAQEIAHLIAYLLSL